MTWRELAWFAVRVLVVLIGIEAWWFVDDLLISRGLYWSASPAVG